MSAEHPSARALEAHFAGEPDAATEAHVAACEACAAFVASLKQGSADFLRAASADDFIDATLRKASRERPSVVPFERVLRARIYWGLAPLAAAALLLLVFRPPQSGVPGAFDVPSPRASSPSAGGGTSSVIPETTFKGGFAVALIRERGGAQQRVVGPVEVVPQDRLRLEVALEGPTPLAAGALAEDGTWVPLIEASLFDGGTFFSEFSLRFDDVPSSGHIVVGAPEAVARVRLSRNPAAADGLRVIPFGAARP